MRPKLVVIGAGGFIGSFLVEEAIERGYQTWAGVRASTSTAYLDHLDTQFVELSFDTPHTLLAQLTAIKQQIGKWDYIVYNLGATKCRKSEDFERINYHYLRLFVETLTQLEMQPSLFLFMSSLSAWGAGDELHYTPIQPSDPPRPNTHYGKSKLKAEHYLQEESQLPYIILRPTGVYGARERDYFLMMKTIQRGIDFEAGLRPQRLTFIYVKDLVQAIFLALESGLSHRAYFVTDGASYTAADFRCCIARALHKRHTLTIKLPLAMLKAATSLCSCYTSLTGRTTTLNRDKYHILKQRNWLCNIAPIQEELGFAPQYTLLQGVEECVEWYKQQGWL